MRFAKQHVEQAFSVLRKHGLHPNKQSTKWDIIDPQTGERFPPKAVLRVAKELANDRSWSGGGGPQTNVPLKSRGFDIVLKEPLEASEIASDVKDVLASKFDETTKARLINARLGQGGFREELLEIWERKCSLTGCCIVEVLRASHIKPWRVSNNEERLDAWNGILLAASIDALFDRFLITFAQNGKVMVAAEIDAEALLSLGAQKGQILALKEENQIFMDWHRDEFERRNEGSYFEL